MILFSATFSGFKILNEHTYNLKIKKFYFSTASTHLKQKREKQNESF